MKTNYLSSDPKPRALRLSAIALATLFLGACASQQGGMIGESLLRGKTASDEVGRLQRGEMGASDNTANLGQAISAAKDATGARPAGTASAPRVAARTETQFFQTPPQSEPSRTTSNVRPAATSSSVAGDVADLSVNFDQLPLGQFAQTLFGTMLKRGVSIDPAVSSRRELVSLRTPRPQTPQQLYELGRSVLKAYSVSVIDIEGLVRIVPDASQGNITPEIRRGRALPEVPEGLRPVFYLAELEYSTPERITQFVRNVFAGKVQMFEDQGRNAILLNGQRDDVNAALEAIALYDQPSMRGRVSARVVPSFWAAEELARRLVDVLSAEGVSVGLGTQSQAAVLLLPIPALNSVLVFAAGESALNRTLRWARELDQPNSAKSSGGFFTYAVRNTDAADLSKTLGEIMNAQAGAAGAPRQAKVVVNPASNTLIFQGGAADYQQWFSLLQELDRPAKSAMVTVTVAEVRLDDTQQLGFEWLLREFTSSGYRVNVLNNTFGALGGNERLTGLSARINAANGDPRAVLQLLATQNKVRVLSNPTIVARNGETATVQVGDEIPILTSQQSNANTGIASGGVQQTIQYRTTGVILKVKPVIHAGGRIDLEVSQEVSNAARNQLGGTASPTISSRRVDTKMSVTDGSTVLLAGLMEQRMSDGETGIPYLKDVPVAGNLFKSSSGSVVRTELVVLVTPYVMADDFEAEAMTQAFRSQFKWAASANPSERLAPNRAVGAKPAGGEPSDSPALRTNQPKPYVLPEADSKPAARPAAVPPPVAPVQQSSPQGLPQTQPGVSGASRAAPLLPGSTQKAPAASGIPARPAASTAASAPRPSGSAPAGGLVPVSDPDLIKAIQDAAKGK
jgi:general secretion pathway protein D